MEQDEKAYLEWLEKAANQNNPMAMDRLGDSFRCKKKEYKTILPYCRAAAHLGWKNSMVQLGHLLRDGKGCERFETGCNLVRESRW